MMRCRGLDLTKWPTQSCSAVLCPSRAHQSYIQPDLIFVRPTIQYLRSDCVVLSFICANTLTALAPIPKLFISPNGVIAEHYFVQKLQ